MKSTRKFNRSLILMLASDFGVPAYFIKKFAVRRRIRIALGNC